MANFIDAVYLPTLGPHYLWHRLVSGKYGPAIAEKTGEIPDRFKSAGTRVISADSPYSESPCLWLHAVSVGEVQASRELVTRFMADNPTWELRVSTTTATGRKVATDLYGAECVFYYPLDFSWMVKKAIERIRPSLIVLMELEIWPNFLRETRRAGIPVAVANARITERSVRRLTKIPSLAREMGLAVEEWYAQTATYAERLKTIGIPPERIEVFGSIKYDAIPEKIDADATRRYRRLFGCPAEGGRNLIVAGSTHPGEEEAVLEAWSSIAPRGERPRLLLTPRHPERMPVIEKLACRYGTVVKRSALPEPGYEDNAPMPVEADIILGDTMGELAKIYCAADIVFVGGTFTNRGGQNFMEPCGLGKPTVVGPNLWNFSEPAELLGAEQCLRIVPEAGDLGGVFREFYEHPDLAAEMGRRARELLLRQRGVAARIGKSLNVLAVNVLQGKYRPVARRR